MSPHHIRIASRRRFLQFLAASPLLARSALAEGLRPSDPVRLGAARSRQIDCRPHTGARRVRLRAGHEEERSTGAFRLHGDRRRRRSHAARQPRGLSQVRAAAAPAGRCQQDRHEHRDFRCQIRQPDRDRADRQQPRLSPRWRDRRRQGGEDRQPSADAVHGGDDLDRGCHRRARRAGVVSALYDAAPGSRRSAWSSGPRPRARPSSW